MLKNEPHNVTLTDEQTRQLTEWKNRLKVVQDEIKKAEARLNEVRGATPAAETQLTYLKEQYSEIEPQVEALKTQKDSLLEEVSTLAHKLAEQEKEFNAKDKELSTRTAILSEGEAKVREAVDTIERAKGELAAQVSAHAQEVLSVVKAKQAFLDATESVTWK